MKSKPFTFHWILLFAVFFFSMGEVAQAMPPHPDLLKKFKEGALPLPYYIVNQKALKMRGVNQPPEGLSLQEKILLDLPSKGPSGEFKALALLVDFSDKTSSVTASYFDTLIFGTGAGTVRDYYNEVSYGSLTIVTVNLPSATGWLRAPQTYSYYVNGQNGFGAYPQNAQKLVEDAVDAANAVVDFSQYDNDGDGYVDALFVVHAGPGAELTGSPNDIWSHQWGITPRLRDGVYVNRYSMEPEYWLSPGDMTLGVYCHELGHVLGLPDLYDYDYSSEGVGNWSLMAGGSWNGNLGNSPAHLDAWSRLSLGFAEATIISSNALGLSIPSVESTPTIFYLWNGGAANSEYFLMENRQKIGYDTGLPDSGLLIFHVDETQASNNIECRDHENCNCLSHYRVALEQADGALTLEYGGNRGDSGDPFPGLSNNRTFTLLSTPNSGSYYDCDSDVAVTNISNSAGTMSADVSIAIVTNVSISGYIESWRGLPMGGVSLIGLPQPTVTDSNGYYECEVASGWSGCVRPSAKGYTFAPPEICYENLIEAQTDQNYAVLRKPARPAWIDYPTCDDDGTYPVCWAVTKGATSYILSRSAGKGSSWQVIYEGPDTCFETTASECYRYRVKAVNDVGESTWKNGRYYCCSPCP